LRNVYVEVLLMVAFRAYRSTEVAAFLRVRERFGAFSNMAPGYPMTVAGAPVSSSEALCEPPRAKPRGFPAVSGGIEPPPTAEVFCHMVDAAAEAAGLGRRKSQRASSSAA
jgi:hypothetical protein